jgi:prepilin-type N-terminal cleavage/methylation domain-containing protein/prepilin-type processing-associated H-X9-DG protein
VDGVLVSVARAKLEVMMARRAFSLIELLVIIAILGILLGLSAAGVQRVREAAARARCANHLRQMAAAVHQYETTHRRFPSAGILWSQGPPGDDSGWAWQILPYADGGMNVRRAGSWEQVAAAGFPLIGDCPSKPGPRIFPQWSHNWPARMFDYAGADWETQGFFRLGRVGNQLSDFNGVGGKLMIGEKRLNLSQADFGRNYDDDFGPFCGADHDAMRTTNRAPLPDYTGSVADALSPAGYSREYGDGRFGSSHNGGFNAAYGDGSVSFVEYGIAPKVWAAMGAIRE